MSQNLLMIEDDARLADMVREYLGRIRAVLRRRVDGAIQPGNQLRFGSLEIDRNARTVHVGPQTCDLTSYPFDLLVALAERAGIDLFGGPGLATGGRSAPAGCRCTQRSGANHWQRPGAHAAPAKRGCGCPRPIG